MRACSLCTTAYPSDELDRFSGMDLCSRCRSTDPAAALYVLGIPVEWNLSLGRFCAGAGVGQAQDPDFQLSCVPQSAVHAIMKWVVHEVEVGDPVFDTRIYVRTSDPVRAAELLADEGVQSALLALLSKVRKNELVGNHVTLKGPNLVVNVRPLEALSPARVVDLKLETAALALHLRDGLKG
jgi:hypothetical protein